MTEQDENQQKPNVVKAVLWSGRPKIFRQGDILLRQVPILPPDAVAAADQEGGLTLAVGEQSGHKHVLTGGTVFEAPRRDGKHKIVRVESPARLMHDEHATIDVPPGIYEVVQQRTYVPNSSPTASLPTTPPGGTTPALDPAAVAAAEREQRLRLREERKLAREQRRTAEESQGSWRRASD